ncbi:MAG: type II toxin-antitoxin system Phd/YefM family antitoxin [Deltaproteobacteria bacterium]|nr:type II toxin-antitoxin system Phd/YefM family antitoxin [Deltaproteobacteria bacterium]
MKTMSSVSLRKDLGGVLAEAAQNDEEVIITRSGKPVAVLIGMDRWEAIESILATWEQLQDPENKNKLRAAKADLAAGRIFSHEEIAARYFHRRSA